MSPTAMLTLMFAAIAMFAWSASRRWQLLQIGRPAARLDHLDARLRGTWRYAFRQEKMDYYNPAGLAHKLIFFGFVVLLLRTLVLWGRGFYAAVQPLRARPVDSRSGRSTSSSKDIMGALVVAGTLVFFYYRLVVKPKRMSLSLEGLLILVIIFTMMIADMTYDGASLVLASKAGAFCAGAAHAGTAGQCAAVATIIAPLGDETWQGAWSPWPAPDGIALRVVLRRAVARRCSSGSRAPASGRTRRSSLIFLNLLPHSKHFHIITAIPNVFLRSLTPAGRLEPMAENAEKLMEIVGAAGRGAGPDGAARRRRAHRALLVEGDPRLLHVHRVRALLGQLPGAPHRQDPQPQAPDARAARPPLRARGRAHRAPRRERRGQRRRPKPRRRAPTRTAPRPPRRADGRRPRRTGIEPVNLVPDVIHPDVLWACTTCRACEEQCPVLISYVDKIIDMRRNLVMVKGEFPHELAEALPGHGDQRQPVEPLAHGPRGVGRRARHPDDGREPEGAGPLLGRLRGELRRSREEDRARHGASSSSRRASTSRSSGRKRAARATRRGARATSSSSRCSPRATRRTLNGYKEQGGVKHDRHDVPALLQHAQERVPGLRRSRSKSCTTPTSCSASWPRASSCRPSPSRGASSTTTPATSAATTACTTRRARS